MCGGEEGEFIHKISLNLSPEMRKKVNYPESYDVVCCNDCGMLFADSDLTKADVDNYYIACNMYDTASDVRKDTCTESCKLYYDSIIDYLTPQSRIIDVGCGNGNFLHFLKSKGYENLYGLDPSESSIKGLEKKGIKGIVGNVYDEIPVEMRNKFDVVIISFVLEHLLFPEICLKNLIDLMKEDGRGGTLYFGSKCGRLRKVPERSA